MMYTVRMKIALWAIRVYGSAWAGTRQAEALACQLQADYWRAVDRRVARAFARDAEAWLSCV